MRISDLEIDKINIDFEKLDYTDCKHIKVFEEDCIFKGLYDKKSGQPTQIGRVISNND